MLPPGLDPRPCGPCEVEESTSIATCFTSVRSAANRQIHIDPRRLPILGVGYEMLLDFSTLMDF